jgi:hypothetical protein
MINPAHLAELIRRARVRATQTAKTPLAPHQRTEGKHAAPPETQAQ